MGGRQLPGILAARKLGYFRHVTQKPGNSMEKDLITGTTEGTRRRVRSATAWISDINGLVAVIVEMLLYAVDREYNYSACCQRLQQQIRF